MTEQEFKKQVWRAYDTVEIEGVTNKQARVIAVGFPSMSVRAAIAPGVVEWFKCEQIISHKSATGQPDDMAIIEDLHNKLMAANKRNEDLQAIKNDLEEKLSKNNLGELRKCINMLNNNLVEKKTVITTIESALARIDAAIEKL